jgi:hypothetical protein
MKLEQQHVRTLSQRFIAHTTYSPCKQALTLSLPMAESLFKARVDANSPRRPTFQAMREMGEQRGYWHCDFDRMSGARILVIHAHTR